MKRNLSVVNTSMYDGLGTEEIIALEKKHSANNYAPIPVVFSSAKGVWVTDPEGKKYIDCMAGYSAVNQGHCHPDLIKVVKEQVEICTLSSRAFFNNRFGEFAEFVTKFFGYERVLPANTGTEAVEAAVKLARKWSYTMKAIPENEAIVISCINNFHGRTFGPISLSTDPDSFSQYGPLLPGIIKIPFDDVRALDECLEKHSEKVAAFLVEPIQGEAGVKVPTSGYLKEVAALCSKHNVLFIADEIQSGLGRSGKLLAVDYDDVRPDVLILGKALSGGMYPISAVLADEHIMNVITPGTHGSTFAGNPLASVIGIESLKILVREDMIENSFRMGIVLREKLNEIRGKYPVITDVRGLGLMNAIDVFATNDKNIAYTIVNECRKRGLLIKPTHGHTIRITPPLTIKIEEVQQACSILEEVCATISV